MPTNVINCVHVLACQSTSELTFANRNGVIIPNEENNDDEAQDPKYEPVAEEEEDDDDEYPQFDDDDDGSEDNNGAANQKLHVLLTLTCTLQECMLVDMTMMETTQMVTT